MTWVLYFTSVWAITYLCVDSDIFAPVRDRILYKGPHRNIVRSTWLFKITVCYFCFGTWISLAIYHPFFEWSARTPFIVLFGATMSRAINATLTYLERDDSAE